MEAPSPSFWRRCNSCKSPISWGQKYWICSVSTCTRKRTGLVFCSVSCFDAHVPGANHRDAGAIEQKAQNYQQALAEFQRETSSHSDSRDSGAAAPSDDDILVVVSKVKAYIRSQPPGCNTSDSVMRLLTEKVRGWLDEAIKNTQDCRRQTVLDRDIPEGPRNPGIKTPSPDSGAVKPVTVIRRRSS